MKKSGRPTSQESTPTAGAVAAGSGPLQTARNLAIRLSLALVPLFPARSARAAQEIATTASPASAVFTFPAVIFAALVISWAAEAAQFIMAQGAALAILAWLQTLPEYAVEFVIAKTAAEDEARTHLLIANLTGSLRLLLGLGWPMIYFTAFFFARKKKQRFEGIQLEAEHSIEVVCLLPAVLYWFVIWAKASLTVFDAVILIGIYIFYIWSLRHIPPQEHEQIEELDAVPRYIARRPAAWRLPIVLALFAAGGIILYLVAHPFLESMLALAVSLGISQFVFIQWLAPFLSEFPEKLSAFNWARKIRTAPTAVMNMVSSNFNQWTVLAGTLPIVYSVFSKQLRPIPLDDFQRWEVLLTVSQSTVGMVLLLNMHIATYEALLLFLFWLIQFLYPDTRHIMTFANFSWAAIELVRGARKGFPAFGIARRLMRGDVSVLKEGGL